MKILPKLLALALVSLTFASAAYAQYPERTIKFIVPYSAGGGTDTMARTIVPEIVKALGQKIVIVNRPGAQGQIGMAEIANAKPDGYTLGLVATSDLLVTEVLVDDAGFNMASFNYLSSINISANALIVKEGSPFSTFQEFVDYAKENPGKLTFGVSGNTHVYEIISLENQANIDLNFIRFSGGGESRNALLGGHVDALMIDKRFIPTLRESGAKALVVASEERFEAFPNVPTFQENGINLVNASRRAIVFPLNVPQERIEVILKALDSFAASEDFKNKLATINEVQQYMKGDQLSVSLNNQLKSIQETVDANIQAFSN